MRFLDFHQKLLNFLHNDELSLGDEVYIKEEGTMKAVKDIRIAVTSSGKKVLVIDSKEGK